MGWRWRAGFASPAPRWRSSRAGLRILKTAREDTRPGTDSWSRITSATYRRTADITKTHEGRRRPWQDRRARQQRRNGAHAWPFENISDEAWQEDFDLKLFAAIRFSRLVWERHEAAQMGPHHQRAQHLCQGAAAGHSAPTSVSRAAGMALTKVMANEGGEAQHPGECAAGRPDHERSVGEAPCGLQASEHGFRQIRQGPCQGHAVRARSARRKSSPTWRAFLPPKQGSYITGTAINVDGGRSPVV